MPPILIAEATAEAVKFALLRYHCRQLAEGLPPHQHAPADVRAVAVALGRTLELMAALRGTRRDVSELRRRAEGLEARPAAATAWKGKPQPSAPESCQASGAGGRAAGSS
jgi:hypothetical protein